jgi:dihydrodipicolinate synthase/N-acetylneuraminate lyase
VKAGVAALGLCREEYRLPMVPLPAEKKATLLAALKKHGVLK